MGDHIRNIILLSILMLCLLYPVTSAAESMNGENLSSYQDEFTQPSEVDIDLGETADTVFPNAYEAYLNVVTKCMEQYGETTETNLPHRRFLGLSFLDLIDFDRDGTEELLLGFYVDFTGYVYNVWGYDGQRAVLLQDGVDFYGGDGGRQTVLVVKNTFGTYLLRGAGDDFQYDYYYGYAGHEFGLVKYIGFEPGYPEKNMCMEDGAAISEDEYTELIKQWAGDFEENVEFYSLTSYDDAQANKTREKIDETMQKLQQGGENAETSVETVFSPAEETYVPDDEPGKDYIEISTAEELASIKDNLTGHYILTSDIDLGGAEWTPVGGIMGEEDVLTFEGTFDGQNHTISNFVVKQTDDYIGAGLFGAIDNADIRNLTVENASAYGYSRTSAIVGFAHGSIFENVKAKNITIDVQQKEEASPTSFGSIVGGANNIQIKRCEAEANIYIQTEAVSAVGILAGGVEEGAIFEECKAKGTIERGTSAAGIGGICGLCFDAERFSGCSVSEFYVNGEDSLDVTGIGGIVGISGVNKIPDGNTGPTVFTNCRVEGEGTDRDLLEEGPVSHLVGVGYYTDEFEQYYSASGDKPPAYIIEISSAEELIAIKREQEGYFALTSDIDLGGTEWTPVGGEKIHFTADSIPDRDDNGWGDEEELTLTHVFPGTFDGRNHTISNFTIHQPDDYGGAGLFGSFSSAMIKDLTVEDVTVYGKTCVSVIAGNASDSTIINVTVENVTIYAEAGEEESNGCFGVIVGSGRNCNLADCRAHATINLVDECYNIGIVAGYVDEGSSIINCSAGGTINAAEYCTQMGGICGTGMDIKEISGCTVEDIVFNLDVEYRVAGSIAGVIGITVVEDGRVDPTEISNCTVNNPAINTADGIYNYVDMVGYNYLTDEVMEQYDGMAYNIA